MPAYKPRCRRPNPVFSPAYRALLDAVVECRREAGLSQRELATRLGKCASHVGMIERGQRRIDTLELYRMACAFEVAPERLFARVARNIEAVEAAERQAPPPSGREPGQPADTGG